MRYLGSPLDAVLLDMDGTLIDSTPAVERAWGNVARRHGLVAEEVFAGCHGLPAETTMRKVLAGQPEAVIQAEIATHLENECTDLDGVVALPGALDLLAALDAHGVPWCVVTSAVPRLALARMGAAGIHPQRLVTPEDIERGKPFPDGFLAGAEACGASIERCLAVEDSAAGLDAARAAGAVTIDVNETPLPQLLASLDF